MTSTNVDIEGARQRARAAVDGIADELLRISREIHSHPELAFEERHAMGQLVPFVKAHGFEVATGVYGMETAFRGEWGHGPVTIAVIQIVAGDETDLPLGNVTRHPGADNAARRQRRRDRCRHLAQSRARGELRLPHH